jgi:hypothetical protein
MSFGIFHSSFINVQDTYLIMDLNELQFAGNYKFTVLFCHKFHYVYRIKTSDNES